MNHRIVLRGIFALGLALLSAAAQAQSFRTYLASTGTANPNCTLAAPCRLLPDALAAVTDGGEVWMLDSANYNTGPVNVTKSVTILAVPGALGSVVALGGNAINIATAGVKVALRNLVIVPFVGGAGTNGVVMSAGASLVLDNCLIASLPGHGITVSTAAAVLVTDSTVRGNGGNGLHFENGARVTIARSTVSGNAAVGVHAFGQGASVTVEIADSTLSRNQFGVEAYAYAPNTAKVSVSRSSITGHSFAGLRAQGTGLATLTASENILSSNDSAVTIYAGGRMVATGNAVSNNAWGFYSVDSGLIESAGDNTVRNNTTDVSGNPLAPIAKM